MSTVKKDRLDNGVTVVTEEISTSNSVSIGFWVKVGSKDESEKENGYSHFIEHMLFKGTKKRSYLDIAREVDRVGAYLNASTTREDTCYYINIKKDSFDFAVELLCDIVENSIFPEKELLQEKNVVLEEIKMYNDTPEDLVYENFFKSMFYNHPFGMPITGDIENIKNITREGVIEFYKRNYIPSNLVIAAAGNVEHQNLLKLLRKYKFMSNRANLQPIKNLNNKEFIRKDNILIKNFNQVHICLGFPGISATHSLRYALYIFNTILGSSMSSRLFQKIREKLALCYSIYSFYSSFRETGVFGIYLATSLNTLEKALINILKEVKLIRKKGISKKELEDAKEHIKGNLALAYEQNEVRMNRLARQEIIFGRHFTYKEIINTINSIKLDHIMQIIDIFFPKEYKIIISSVGIEKHKKILKNIDFVI